MNILVINCGSSSLKFQVIDAVAEKLLAKGLCERIGLDGSFTYENKKDGKPKQKVSVEIPDHKKAIQLVLDALTDPENGIITSLDEIGAVGHRVVHGGEKFTSSVVIDEEVLEAIQECAELAPLHNPANLTGIAACRALMPNTPMVAVFDTAFHQTMPEKAYLYAVPYHYYEEDKVRRYGFHGTSHSYVSKEAAAFLGQPYESLKTIVCHLGNGASVSAVKNGKCVDTSMGMTPLDGLVMGTRCGSIDPAIIEFLAHKEGLDIDGIMKILNKESGMLGLSRGLSSDSRDLEAAYEEGNPDGVRAVESFCYSVAKYIGSYAAAMDGVDVLCFTAGIGENSDIVRDKVCSYLHYLGIALDPAENAKRGEDRIISTPESKVKVLVIPTNEELAIARETYALCK